VPDRRGGIVFADGAISICNPAASLRLVGTINDVPIDIKGEGSAKYDERGVEDVELWLVAENTELVDWFSTTAWPHKGSHGRRERGMELAAVQSVHCASHRHEWFEWLLCDGPASAEDFQRRSVRELPACGFLPACIAASEYRGRCVDSAGERGFSSGCFSGVPR
jgi:hypothetical protein